MMQVHTYYSFRYGTLSPGEVLDAAAGYDYETVLLADINSTAGSINFVRLATQRGIKPVLGIDFRNGVSRCFLAIARNNEGFAEINAFLSRHLHSGKPIPNVAPPFENAYVVYPFSPELGQSERPLRENEYVGVHPRDLLRFGRMRCGAPKNKAVMWHPFTFLDKRGFNAHRLLRAIDNNCLLSKLPKTEEGDAGDVWMHRNELMALYADAPQLIANTVHLLQDCRIGFEFGDAYPHKNLRCYTGSPAGDEALLRRLCRDNLSYRYPSAGEEVHARVEKELEVIVQKDFASYFLINWDIVSHARKRGFFYVGRGSGANSIVAYILRITDVDPIELDLYFERFINLYRRNPPDFDIDFSWRDRPEMTEYIFNRFPNAALLATYNTFQYRAVVRELGKVFGLPKEEIDRLAAGKNQTGGWDRMSELVLRYSRLIQGFPSHLSIHAGGILISEASIHNYSPTWMPPKGFPTVQFDMVVAEDIGLYKFDILGQRGLGKIKDALAIISENRPEVTDVDVHDLPRLKRDPGIRKAIGRGDAIGCFYVESPAMRMLMKKLRVEDYLGLVAASSVIRPGVSRSGMMREFIERYRNPEKRKEAHPVMLEIMPETFGVMVYQEDVIKVAHLFAGLTLGEADVLRRGMSGKFRSREEFAKAKGKFFANCKRKGYADELTAEVWRQVESFAGYAFAKGHSASYAVESYQSLFLKVHFPVEYMAAVLNNGGGFYSREFYVHEARMKGAEVVAPCVNTSRHEAVVRGKRIYLGLGMINTLEDESIHRILRAREAGGAFEGLDDFMDRVSIGVEQVDVLVRVDAFRFTGVNKRELLWYARSKMGTFEPEVYTPRLFFEPRKRYVVPDLKSTELEDAFDQWELLGFPLIDPFKLLAEPPGDEPRAKDLPKMVGKRVSVSGYLVTARPTVTARGEVMGFGNFVDRRGDFIDTVHFPPVYRKFPFRGPGVYRVTGVVTEDYDCVSIEAEEMEKLAVIPDARYVEG